jgi:transcriptional regulator with XRE-family HTH domain
LLGWSQTALAKAAALSEPAIKRYETARGARVSEDAVARMIAALEAAGVEFTNGRQPGVRIKATTTVTDEGRFPRLDAPVGKRK